MTICLLTLFTSYAFAAGFSDVQGHWAEKQINKLTGKGLVGGYSDGTFNPNKEVTRAELLALTNRIFGISKEDKNSVGFTDVKAGDWYFADVAAAKSAGYIGGYSDGTFRPNQPVTRQEVAAILARLLKLEPATEGLAQFSDFGQMAEWSRGSVGAVAAIGLMRGMPDNKFYPLNNITRAEAVVALDRAAETVQNQSAINGTVTFDGKVAGGVIIRVFEANGYQVLKETSTNSSGNFIMDFKPGIYDITATTDKEVAYLSDIKVTTNKVTTATLTLQNAAIISGSLTDKNGQALNGAKVMFTTNPTFVATTDNNGKYSITVLPERTYTVRSYRLDEKDAAPVVVKSNLSVGSAGKHTLDAMSTPFSVSETNYEGNTSRGGNTSQNVNNPPAIANPIDAVTGTAGGTVVTIDVSNTFTDADGNTLTLTAQSSDETIATVAVNGTTVVVTPIAAGTATITVTAADGQGGTISDTIIITVSAPPPVNNTPVANAVADQALTVGGASVTLTAALLATDPDGDALTVTGAVYGSAGIVNLDWITGDMVLTPMGEGTTTVTASVYDGGGLGVDVTFNVTVAAASAPPVNNTPAAKAVPGQALTVGGASVTLPAALLATDPDGDALTVTGAVYGSTGIVNLDWATGNLVLTPMGAGTTTVTASVYDGGGLGVDVTFNVTVAAASAPPVNNKPAAKAVPSQALTVGGASVTLTAALLATDPDGDALTVTGAVYGSAGIVNLDWITGGMVLTPMGEGTTTVTASVYDGGGLGVDVTFNVIVAAASAPPVNNTPAAKAVPGQALTVGGASVTLTAALLATDPDGDALTVTGAVYGSAGIVNLDWITGNLVLTPMGAGTTTVTASVYDGGGLGVDVTFNVTVAAASAPPVNNKPAAKAVPGQALTVGGASVTLPAALLATDPDGDALTVTGAVYGSAGIVNLDWTTGDMVLTPMGEGTTTVTASVYDGGGLGVDVTFNVTVADATAPPGNCKPMANALDGQTLTMTIGGTDVTLPAALLATVPDGDTLTVTGAVYGTAGIVNLDWTTGDLVLSPVGEGSTTVTASVYDEDGEFGVEVTFDVIVNT